MGYIYQVKGTGEESCSACPAGRYCDATSEQVIYFYFLRVKYHILNITFRYICYERLVPSSFFFNACSVCVSYQASCWVRHLPDVTNS